jgi:hypothetical protein
MYYFFFLSTDSTYRLFFVDGNDIQTEANWIFADGSPVSFLVWDHDQPEGIPDEDCMLVLDGKYHDVPCNSYKQIFICEKDFTISL